MSDLSILKQRLRLGTIAAIVTALSIPAIYTVSPYAQENAAQSFMPAGILFFAAAVYSILEAFRLKSLGKLLARLSRREEQLSTQNSHFSAALENMSQGLCMFDGEQRLIICNSTYAQMYGLSSEQAKPGVTLQSILQTRLTNGTMPKDTKNYVTATVSAASKNEMVIVERELIDGRIVSVVRQPMASGGWVTIHMDVTEKRKNEKKVEYLANHDALTGMPNRIQLRECIEQNLARSKRGESFAVLCLDLDHFKNINDTLGHAVGDNLLHAVSERLRKLLRDTDLVARTGGDEFTIVQTNIDIPMLASASLADRVVEALSGPFDLGNHQVVTGTSIGIAIAPDDGSDADQLLKNADMALYRAKGDGRGTFHFFEAAMDARAQARRLLEIDLRKAVATGEFEVHYQPIIHLAENKISGFEALVRWNHPSKGRISPDKFIPLAEETGLIVQIGEWVVRQACVEAKAWPSDLRVAVNVSPVQFRNKNLVPSVMSALAASGLPSNRLELEITEAAMLQNNDATLAVLHQLRGLGVRISMDDFGTGYSSLSYLQSFPFDKIKIDQSFIRGLIDKPESIAIIRAVAGLGRSFGMTTTAEGVETQAQVDQMRAEGCTEVQGYFYSKPMPASEIAQMLSGFQRAQEAA